jgi:hypothetical protein
MTQHDHAEYHYDCFECGLESLGTLGVPSAALPSLQAWADNTDCIIEIKGFKGDRLVFSTSVEPTVDFNPS